MDSTPMRPKVGVDGGVSVCIRLAPFEQQYQP